MRHLMTALTLAVLCQRAFAQTADAAKLIPDTPRDKQDLAVQQELQKRIQMDTDQTVRRIRAMLRAMAFQKLAVGEEQGVLNEVAQTLAALSKDQMSQVIARLQASMEAKSDQKAGAEFQEAYKRHREILVDLTRLLDRYDAVHSLEQASERLDGLAKDELELFLRQVQLTQEGRRLVEQIAKLEDGVDLEIDESKSFERKQRAESLRKRLDQLQMTTSERLADDQSDTQRGAAELIRQLADLKPDVLVEQQERIAKVEAGYGESKLDETFRESIRMFRAKDLPEDRASRWAGAGALQWRAASRLKELSRALRPPADDLEALREARQLLEQTIERQLGLMQEAEQAPPREWNRMVARARDLGDRQARIEFEALDVETFLKPRAAAVAAKIEPAEALMREAQEGLRGRVVGLTSELHTQVLELLSDALAELDRLIQEEENARKDTVTRLKELSEDIEKLIRDQKETKAKTVGKEKEPSRLAQVAPEQKALRDRTDQLGAQPLPNKAIDEALDDAAKAMGKATEALERKDAPEAKTSQDKAIAALEKAKKAADEALAKELAEQDRTLPAAALQIAKAIEQTELARDHSLDAAREPDPSSSDSSKNAKNANAEAQIATGQAQALAPQDVQPQLGDAQKALADSAQSLQKGEPGNAVPNQEKALRALKSALKVLNEQLAKAGLPEVHPGQPSDALASGDPGQGEGQEGAGRQFGQGRGRGQGQGQGLGEGPGQGLENNESRGKGDREPDGNLKNSASSTRDVKGGDTFLSLPKRQRDLIRQSLSEGLPPEYSAQIQQYYVNLARGRAATIPGMTEKKK
ncbi:MAG: hypothetical protein L0170_11710 [Acidobacteria bacterium]|nr:hypothetical protein [Acidobacteriota bacterium]